MTHNIFRIQDNEFIIYCIAFIKYILSGKILFHCTNLFSPNHYKENEKIIYKPRVIIYMSSLKFS